MSKEEDQIDDGKKKDQDPDNSIDKMVKEKVNEELKEIKGKLDAAFRGRDEALRKLAELEQEAKEKHLKQLEDEGKHAEALKLKLAEKEAKLEALEKRNTELSRDVKVRATLSGLNFRNDRAVEVAYKEIVSQLKQNENGIWVHTSGVSLEDYITAFAKDEDNAFLFKAKGNSGTGLDNMSNDKPGGKEKKSLFEYSQAELIRLAQEGKLRRTS